MNNDTWDNVDGMDRNGLATGDKLVTELGAPSVAGHGLPGTEAAVASARFGPAEENVVEIVGTVVTQRWRGQETITFTGMTALHARTARLALQVNEEDGDAYGIRLVCPQHAAGAADVLDHLAAGDRIRVRGRLGWRATYDMRYATADEPVGRLVRELVVTVLELERAADTAIDGSWVRAQGTIRVPPSIRWHEVAAGMQVARTSVQVALHQPSQRPGSRAVIVQTETIPVDFPLDLPDLSAALRAGNQVVVEGRLELFRQRINGERDPLVGEAVATLRQSLAVERAGLAAEERGRAERHGAGQVRRLLYEDRLRLRAGYVELVSGEPLDDIGVAVENHRIWTREQQARRELRQQRRAARTAVPEECGATVTGGSGSEATPDGNQRTEEPRQRPIRHRRLAAHADAEGASSVPDGDADARNASHEPLPEPI